MVQYRTAIEQIARRICPDMHVSLFDIEEKMTRKGRIITVFLNKIGGITLDECAQFSRALSAELDALDLIAERYYLEVSSPGLERPLKLKSHFMSAINEMISVKWASDSQKIQSTGILLEVNPETIVIEERDGTKLQIPINSIDKAKTVFTEGKKRSQK